MELYRQYLKRLIDCIMALLMLIITMPIFLITIVALLLTNRGHVFFIQERPGLNEKPFKIWKFKTMNDTKGENGTLLPDNQRITPIGKIIRKLSIDELPQLINVIIGDMSLIGPRPLLFKYIPLYSKEQSRRHEVRPGITGWAQVNGRNSISWSKRFELDVYYVNHLTFMFDMKIVMLTIVKVLKREGVNQSEERPMQPFRGNNFNE